MEKWPSQFVCEATPASRLDAKPTSQRFIFLQAVKELIRSSGNGRGRGTMTTLKYDGTCYLRSRDTFATPTLDRIISLSLGSSQEVENIRLNPSIEWMFSRFDERAFAYAKGKAELIEGVEEIGRVLTELGFRMNNSNKIGTSVRSDMIVINTHVTEVSYSIPEDRLFESFNLDYVSSYVARLMKSRSSLGKRIAS